MNPNIVSDLRILLLLQPSGLNSLSTQEKCKLNGQIFVIFTYDRCGDVAHTHLRRSVLS